MNQVFIQILIAYTAIVLTVVGGILTFLLYHFMPLKNKVEIIWTELHGSNGSGHIDESQEARESIREIIETTQNNQQQLKYEIHDIRQYLVRLSRTLNRETEIDNVPTIHEQDYEGTYEEFKD